MRRRFLLASALIPLAIASPALAQTDVDDERTETLRTSTANEGQPGDIVITTSGRVTLAGPGSRGIILDSDNDVDISGVVDLTGDDAIGVEINGGVTGSLTLAGRISVGDEETPQDTDGDGFPDGPTAIGQNRYGVAVTGDGTFTGDITQTASGQITVAGNDSAGILIDTAMVGDMLLAGGINVVGDRSHGIIINSILTGDIDLIGTILARGEDASGLMISAPVAGALRLSGSITTTGYRFDFPPASRLQDRLDEDTRFQSYAAVAIHDDVDGGVFLSGPGAEGDSTAPRAIITQRGSGAALLIEATADSGDLVLGEVVLPAIEDDPDTTDVDESVEAQNLGYGLVNRGSIFGQGELDGISATGIRIAGYRDGDTLYTTTLFGGFRNEGAVNVSATDGNATGFFLGEGGIVDELSNTNTIIAQAFGREGSARAVIIGSGAEMTRINNEGFITAIAPGGGGAVAIRDFSGTVQEVNNTGRISARRDAGNAAINNASEAEGIVEATAIDLSRNHDGAVVRQYLDEPELDENGEPIEQTAPRIAGDIRFGDGEDRLVVEAGEVVSTIYFGDGVDELSISGGGRVFANLIDEDGSLIVNVADGELTIGNRNNAEIAEATFADGSRLIFEVDEDGLTAGSITASGTVNFEAGARVTASLTNLVGDGAEFIVLTAGELIIEDAISELENTNAPYLYQSSLTRNPEDDNQLVLTLRRRTADELGMHENQAAVYETAYTTWTENAALGSAMASLITEEEFFAAYDQLLPEYAASAIQFALASNDSTVGALSNRLEAVRRSPDGTGGLWIQEFAYYADRAAGQINPGYRGHGIGVALGADRPAGPFYAVGVNFVGAASEIEEADGIDDPMTSLTSQLGVYAGAEFGGTTFDVYFGAGVNSFEAGRNILINSFSANTESEWTGYHFSGSARLGRQFTVREGLYLEPSVAVDYLSLFEESYSETGGGLGIDLFIDERDSTIFSGTAALTLGGLIDRGNSWWSPHIRLGYRSEFSGPGSDTLASYVGYDEVFTLRAEELPGSGGIFGFGLTAGSGYSTFSFAYDADIRDDFIRHTGRLVIRLVF